MSVLELSDPLFVDSPEELLDELLDVRLDDVWCIACSGMAARVHKIKAVARSMVIFWVGMRYSLAL